MGVKEKSIFPKIRDVKIPGPGRDSLRIDKGKLSQLIFLLNLIWLILIVVPHILLAIYKWVVPKEEEDVEGKVVVITGAGGGLGRQLSLQFAQLGSQVICVDIAKDANKETLKQIVDSTQNNNCMAVNCDLSDPNECRQLAEQVINKYQRVDIVLHGAAILAVNSFQDVSDQDIKKVMDVNLLATFWLFRAFLPHMKKRREGQLVVINSMINYVDVAYMTLYTASKAGLRGLTNSLIAELRNNEDTKNIKITSVHPWLMDTFDYDIIEKVSTTGLENELKRKIMLSPSESARQIIVGIRRGYERFCIPGIRTTNFLVGHLLTMLPTEFRKAAMDFFNITRSPSKGMINVSTNSKTLTTKSD